MTNANERILTLLVPFSNPYQLAKSPCAEVQFLKLTGFWFWSKYPRSVVTRLDVGDFFHWTAAVPCLWFETAAIDKCRQSLHELRRSLANSISLKSGVWYLHLGLSCQRFCLSKCIIIVSYISKVIFWYLSMSLEVWIMGKDLLKALTQVYWLFFLAWSSLLCSPGSPLFSLWLGQRP